MQTFEITSGVLTIKNKVTDYSFLISYKNDSLGIAIEDAEASVCKVTGREGLYLRFNNDSQEIVLKICDRTKEKDMTIDARFKNREVADYIWETTENMNRYSMVYEFTTDHMCNWED